MDNHFDVIVIGAGISGIGAGYHLQTKCPGKSYAILEGRDTIGGTWDLFKYPGIRSDSDMYTLGFSFFPWKEKEAIADGPSILKYLEETSKKFNIDNIDFGNWLESRLINVELSEDMLNKEIQYLHSELYKKVQAFNRTNCLPHRIRQEIMGHIDM